MKNYVQDGNCLTLVAPSGGVAAGDVVVIGTIPVVAHEDADVGESFVGSRVGVFKFPTASSPTAGAAAYVTSAGAIVTSSSGNTLVGAFVAAKDAAGEAEVLFTG